MLPAQPRSETDVGEEEVSGDLGWDKRDWWPTSESAGTAELEKRTNTNGEMVVNAF